MLHTISISLVNLICLTCNAWPLAKHLCNRQWDIFFTCNSFRNLGQEKCCWEGWSGKARWWHIQVLFHSWTYSRYMLRELSISTCSFIFLLLSVCVLRHRHNIKNRLRRKLAASEAVPHLGNFACTVFKANMVTFFSVHLLE